MNSEIIVYVEGFLVLAAVAVFVVMYGTAIVKEWRNDVGEKMNHKPEFVYVATTLAGLVGGVAAMMFNVEYPEAAASAGSPAAQNDENAAEIPAATQAKYVITKAVNPVSPDKKSFVSKMAALYTIAYLVVGLGALATWVHLSNNTSDLVKNVALISFGLLIAIVTRVFHSISAA